MKKSESIKEIATAFALFQAEVTDPSKGGDNPHFKSKFVELNDLLMSVRPVLSRNGLSIMQEPSGNGQDITISTILLHNSGEWMEFEPLTLKAAKADPQGAGSAITYGRRYALSSILGVAWDEDDDGNKASQSAGKEKQPSKVQTSTQPQKTAPQPNTDVTEEDKVLRNKMVSLVKELNIMGEIKSILQEKWKVEDSKHLNFKQLVEVVDYLEALKANRSLEDDATLKASLE
jgi:hypothetical protein